MAARRSRSPRGDIHGDYHAIWIDPKRPEHIVVGNDGGLGVSRDRGATWDFVTALPMGQFYHVAVDMDVPYHVYGGLQDNGAWRGPVEVGSRTDPQSALGPRRRRRRLRHPPRSRGLAARLSLSQGGDLLRMEPADRRKRSPSSRPS